MTVVPSSPELEPAARPRWVRIARAVGASRLTHFVVLGALLFAVAPRAAPAGRDVHLSKADLDVLRAERARKLGVRALSADEAARVEERAIEDELFVREAVRLGLDDGDAIVRQRLVQKMLFLVEESAHASRSPTEAELAAFLERAGDRFRRPARLSFVHVLARSTEAAAALRPAVEAWSVTAARDAIPPFGEALPVSRSVSARAAEIAATFGAPFATALEAAPLDAWVGPIASRQGAHLVRVLSRSEGQRASLDEVREEVRAALLQERRRTAVDDWLRAALAHHRVDVDGRRVTTLSPGDRVAPRGDLSGED